MWKEKAIEKILVGSICKWNIVESDRGMENTQAFSEDTWYRDGKGKCNTQRNLYIWLEIENGRLQLYQQELYD